MIFSWPKNVTRRFTGFKDIWEKCSHVSGWGPGHDIYQFDRGRGGQDDVFAPNDFCGLSECYHRVPRVK